MVITQKIQKIKKNSVNFLKVQCFFKTNLMTFKQLADNNVVNNALITQKIQKNEKKNHDIVSKFNAFPSQI